MRNPVRSEEPRGLGIQTGGSERRIVCHADERRGFRKPPRRGKGKLQPLKLAGKDALVLAAGVLAWKKPPAGAREQHAVQLHAVVLYRVHALRQKRAEPADAAPPVVVVALEKDLAAGQLRDLADVGQRALKLHRPTQIAGQQHHVLGRDPLQPIFPYARKMARPMRAKYVHGLIAIRQVEISDRVNRHRPHRPPMRPARFPRRPADRPGRTRRPLRPRPFPRRRRQQRRRRAVPRHRCR